MYPNADASDTYDDSFMEHRASPLDRAHIVNRNAIEPNVYL